MAPSLWQTRYTRWLSQCYPLNLPQVIAGISLAVSGVISKQHNGHFRTKCPMKMQKIFNRYIISFISSDEPGKVFKKLNDITWS